MSSSSTQQQVLLANGSGMEEFLSEFLSVYTCGAYGSSSSDPATAQFSKPKSTASVDTTAASSTTTTTLAKNDGGGAMEEFISEFVSFYSCNVGLPTLPPPQPSSAESNEEAPTTTATTDGQLVAKEEEEEGAVEEFLREFIAFYSMGTIGTTDPTSNTTSTTNNEPSIEKAKAYYPASSPTESNPGKSTSEEDMGMMKEFLREFVAFYTLQGEDVVAPPVGVDGESPMFAPAVSSEEENTGAAGNNNNSPAIAEESRNDTPTVDDDDDTEDEEDEDDTNVIEAVANNADNGLPFPLNTMENKPASLPTAPSSSSSTTMKQQKKSSRSFVPKKMKKLFSSKKKSASAQAVQ
jgi:hypothetical protein